MTDERKGIPLRSAKVPDEIWDPARAIAKERGDSLSQLWRDALERYTKRHGS